MSFARVLFSSFLTQFKVVCISAAIFTFVSAVYTAWVDQTNFIDAPMATVYNFLSYLTILPYVFLAALIYSASIPVVQFVSTITSSGKYVRVILNSIYQGGWLLYVMYGAFILGRNELGLEFSIGLMLLNILCLLLTLWFELKRNP